jgi:hypothetical protein
VASPASNVRARVEEIASAIALWAAEVCPHPADHRPIEVREANPATPTISHDVERAGRLSAASDTLGRPSGQRAPPVLGGSCTRRTQGNCAWVRIAARERSCYFARLLNFGRSRHRQREHVGHDLHIGQVLHSPTALLQLSDDGLLVEWMVSKSS